MNTMRQKMVAGNWKQNGDQALVKTMQDGLSKLTFNGVEVVVCPPFPYLGAFEAKGFKLGAQNLSLHDSGAHTGEVSGSMLKEVGCQYVIVGHSERRADNSEDNEVVAQKVKQALAAGLTPVLCFGESEQVRDSGQLFDFIQSQLEPVIALIGVASLAETVLAYEPIWAIGTGRTATPEQAQEVHQFVRSYIAKQDASVAANLTILYGGSVKADNAELLFAQPDIDGGLIGGASLKLDDFVAICQAAE